MRPNLYLYAKINSDNKFEATFESTPANPIGPDEKVPDYKWYSFYFDAAKFMRMIKDDGIIKNIPDYDFSVDTILTKIASVDALTNINKIDLNKFHIVSTKKKWIIEITDTYGNDTQRFNVK